jgi:hypothetical protein
MRVITPETDEAWRSEVKAGPTRPVVRATVQKAHMRTYPYNTENAPGADYDHERPRRGHFANLLFGGEEAIREIRGLRRCSWSRSVDQDVAECTLTVLNSELVSIGDLDESDDFELPGYFTFSRGTTLPSENRWGFTSETGWNDVLAPDRLVRTYEGYGSDMDVAPGDDPNLYISGTWLIDEVSYASNGDIEIQMRDLGRLLVDAIAFPPIVPRDDYPMTWSRIRTEQVEGRDATGGDWGVPKSTVQTSNDYYVGAGIQDTPKYVQASGVVMGHKPRDPLRDDEEDERKYWLSTGQESPDSMVWWQQTFDNPEGLAAIRFRTSGGPFKVYVSVQRDDGKWYGKKKIPYKVTTEGIDIEAKIPFVQSLTAERGRLFDLVLRRKYANVKRIRLTFTHLRRMWPGGTYRWRAGLHRVRVYTGPFNALDFAPGTKLKAVGNYRDFSDIVRWCAAWAGFWWPESNSIDWMRFSTDGPKEHYTYPINDAALPRGRVWGTFQNTGTGGEADLTAEQFDKQPLLSMIQHVKDIVGFNFWIDEAGGVVWRMPNLYEAGNYVTRDHKSSRFQPPRTTDFVTIDEEETLLDYSTRVSSRNLRERIFVSDAMGKHGAVVKGYTPYRTGLRRIAGWSDQHFRGNRECRVAADMIAARQMFDFRRSRVSIWGNPAIQVDDQIRIFERVTNETYFHYVLGVSSDLDMDQGTWSYALETHWLGERRSDAWVIDPEVLDGATQSYLNLLGSVD